jgi:HK97 family phage prohead protease
MEVQTMKNNNPLQRRSYSFEVRADQDEQGGSIITGRPIVYDSMTDLGWFNEIIERGALNKTNLQDVRFLVNHDTSKIPLARSRKNNKNSTMQLTVDDEGMSIRVTLDTENNADARSLYSAVQRGDISGMSFMFSIEREEWEELESDHPTRRIKEIGTVVEVSAVTFPAYEQTEISTRCKEALDSARRAVDTARKQRASVDTDELELEKLKAKYLYNI